MDVVTRLQLLPDLVVSGGANARADNVAPFACGHADQVAGKVRLDLDLVLDHSRLVDQTADPNLIPTALYRSNMGI